MKDDSVISFKKPEGNFNDHLTEILRHGCARILGEALEVEIEAFIGHYRHLYDEEGRQRVIRNGYLPKRGIQTGIGQVVVRVPRSRDRGLGGRISFRSSLLPPYLRRTRSLEELLPWLYLKGVSTGDFSDALGALVGSDAPGLSAGTIGRLKEKWKAELEEWRKWDLRGKRYIYLWVDGIYCNVRMEERQCLLVIIGATEDGKKELVALEDGYRESELSWMGVLRDLKRRGLENGAELVTGDGALGFWKAVEKMYPETKWQRCWVHKTANVLNKLPKGLQGKAKQMLYDIWMAPCKEEAEKNFDRFLEQYGAKYPKAAECLKKDRAVLLTFYDFPAEHWKHIRTTNPIESTFATVRLRIDKVQELFYQPDRCCHGISIVSLCREAVAEAQWSESITKDYRREEVCGWYRRGCRLVLKHNI